MRLMASILDRANKECRHSPRKLYPTTLDKSTLLQIGNLTPGEGQSLAQGYTVDQGLGPKPQLGLIIPHAMGFVPFDYLIWVCHRKWGRLASFTWIQNAKQPLSASILSKIAEMKFVSKNRIHRIYLKWKIELLNKTYLYTWDQTAMSPCKASSSQVRKLCANQ